MYKKVNLFYEPEKVFDNYPQYKDYCEMSEFEQAFLCGLLKERNPQKILEIGTSAGGTTAVILQCLSLLESDALMYSIDLNDNYYRNSEYKTGFVAKNVNEKLRINWHLMTGEIAPVFLNDIGTEFDFLILDTVHSLPGELLDFIACLPFLSEDAIVVLHDVSLNVRFGVSAFATKVLFDVVKAEKFLMIEDTEKIANYPNIAAFKVTNDTRKYIADVFSALTISWAYMPDNAQLNTYKEFYKKYYSAELTQIYNCAVSMQKYIWCRNYKNDCMEIIFSKWKTAKIFLIFGCGTYGKMFFDLAKEKNLKTDAFLVSDETQIDGKYKTEIPMYTLENVPYSKEDCTVLITCGRGSKRQVINELLAAGFMDII